MISLEPVSPTEFDAFALSAPSGNFYQTAAMVSFRESLGWKSEALLLKKDGKAVAGAIVAAKNGEYKIAQGPLLEYKDTPLVKTFLEEVEKYVKRNGGVSIEVYPYEVYQIRDSSGNVLEGPYSSIITTLTSLGWSHKGFTTEYDFTAHRWNFVKDLTGISTEAELLASYRQTTRQTIRKLDTAHYSVKKMAYDELSIVKKLIDSSNVRNKVHDRPLSYWQNLYTHFGDAVEFLTVYYDGTPISTGVFVAHPRELAYFHSGADEQYRHLYGGHFLQHHVMNRAIQQGVKRYNFYGVHGSFAKNPLLVYKSGFRGFVEEYVGGFYKIINPTKYALRRGGQGVKKLIRKLKP